ncbi:SinR family protein [Mucilaginibacter sp. cycad4]|uniref:SinR family protein n=1 Tax=Mucilaginibacter sp. cycad4 TaxID=3342096 RepID=UPI002AAABB51|nr:SinR family protein [Mucilaginibacter gossypii]WPV00806.1 SinR family protein [Mucilaginibacter gossypii]
MNTYIIGYDLDKPGQDYTHLIEEIKKIGTWWHCLDSTWLVRSALSAKTIRDQIVKLMDKNDKVLVAKLSGEAAWFGFDKNCNDWLLKNIA